MEWGGQKVSFGAYSRIGLAAIFVPLYLGPVLSGWAHHPLATVPVFALAFLLFMAATRRPNLNTPAGQAGLAIMAVVQLLLVAVGFGAGLTAAQLFGDIDLPFWGPIALTALAALVGAWRYSDTAEMNVFLDSAISRLEALDRDIVRDMTDVHPEPRPGVQAALDECLAALRALPKDANVGMIDPIVQRLESTAGVEAFDPFYDAAGEVDGREDRRIDLGLLRFVASPFIRRKLVQRGEGGMAAMLLISAEAPGTRAEARSLLHTLIDDGVPLSQLPDPVWLAELDETYPGEGYDRLIERRGSRG